MCLCSAKTFKTYLYHPSEKMPLRGVAQHSLHYFEAFELKQKTIIAVRVEVCCRSLPNELFYSILKQPILIFNIIP